MHHGVEFDFRQVLFSEQNLKTGFSLLKIPASICFFLGAEGLS
jgi:hypothetical protein